MRSFLARLFRFSNDRLMQCDEVGRLLQHYIDGHLDERRANRLAAHLEDCLRCGLEANTYQRIKGSLAERRGSVPADSLARLREFGERLARGDEPVDQ